MKHSALTYWTPESSPRREILQASQKVPSLKPCLCQASPSTFHQPLQASVCQEWFSLTERRAEPGVSDFNCGHTAVCQNMKLYPWYWFNIVSVVVTRKRKEIPGSLWSRAQNCQPGKTVQLLRGTAIPKAPCGPSARWFLKYQAEVMCVHLCMHFCIHVCIYVSLYVCVCVCIYMCIPIFI